MANDVKALPVVAWIWRWADGEEEVVFVDATTIKFNPEFEDVPTQIASLVRQSDAESALAELRQRADTAEARLERAKALLRNAGLQLWDAEASVGLRADIAAFLGEGNANQA